MSTCKGALQAGGNFACRLTARDTRRPHDDQPMLGRDLLEPFAASSPTMCRAVPSHG